MEWQPKTSVKPPFKSWYNMLSSGEWAIFSSQGSSIRKPKNAPEKRFTPDNPMKSNPPDFQSIIRKIPRVGFIALLFFYLCCSFVYAEDSDDYRINRIKSDPNYLWASGEAESLEDAKRIAEKDLLGKIQVSITVSSEIEKRESGEGENSSIDGKFIEKFQSYSSMYLKGLENIQTRIGKSWSVLTFIHRDSLANSFELRKHKIRSLFATALNEAEAGRMGEALRNLYWSYLLASTYPDTIHLPQTLGNDGFNAQVAIRNQITKCIDDIEIVAEECYRDGSVIVAPLVFSHENKPVNGLSFTYYGGLESTEYALVLNGRADIPLYDEPVDPKRTLVLTFEYAYENEMNADIEIAELYRMFPTKNVAAYKSVELSFPWMIRDDFIRTARQTSTMETTATQHSPQSQPELVERQHCEAVRVLDSCRETIRFLDVLDQYQKLGVLDFGRRGDFGNGRDCYIAIFDEKIVENILYYDGNHYQSLKNDRTYLTLSDNFRGKRQVWIKEQK